MKKIFLMHLSIFMFANSSFASGITADATNASCDNATLETYSGSSNLQANWQANTINLHWYNGDTILDVQDAADTCNYDGTLTVPSTPPTRTGYTFNGWTLRHKNLFDQQNATLYKSSFATSGSGGSWQAVSQDSYAVTYAMAVEPNTTYTIQKKGGNRLIITGFNTIKVPNTSSLAPNFYIKTDINNFENGSYTFTTPAYCVWIVFSLRNNNSQYQFPYDVQIEKGSTATDYEPYHN